ncbi:MAG: tRNA (uridine(54)-C5)-methyltransferase TrmA [Campylobacteraceae bacterium]|jgi:tRNA (uracil-5-)-methyltransferase|nr:tRNA (uridine(54)-C5)-methyltransferase TrmA [Campylobacteraceae bacterium]
MMKCAHFGVCNACVNYVGGYNAQLERKLETLKAEFGHLWSGEFEVFDSPEANFRDRVEFRVYKEGDDGLYFALTNREKRFFEVKECEILSHPLNELVKTLPPALNSDNRLREKLFSAELLGNGKSECVLNLVYHRKLDDEWQKAAQELSEKYGVYVNGRSKGVIRTVGQDYVTRSFDVAGEKLTYIIKQNCFSQPNGAVNEKMLNWAVKNASGEGDLIELYCGSGNFTMAFAKKYRKVFATEVVKEAIDAAKKNRELNNLDNLYLGRISAEEASEALTGAREFTRLQGINLKEFDFHTIFVDPPRSGLGEKGREFAANYDEIIYISCSPETLKTDLEYLTKTHEIKAFAAFDQFAYTNHLECGVKLIKKDK